MEKKRKGVTITPPPSAASSEVINPTVWISDNFAQDWFADALQEAWTGKDYHAVRREIIFATCFLESYIFEWTRLKVQLKELNDYFPSTPRFKKDPRSRRALKDKWKDIPVELFEAGKLPSEPKLHLSPLGNLLKHRHGLVHAAASRPATDSQREDTKPFPAKDMLKKRKHGWAVKVAVDLVKELHHAVGDSVPEYVEYP